MNTRERNLLIALGAVVFFVANGMGYKMLTRYHSTLKSQIAAAKTTLEVAHFAREQAEAIEPEIEWLDKNLPEPKEAELVPSQLESLVSGRATGFNLIVTRPKILENSVDGAHYERARFRINVSGKEEDLYRWLVSIQSPRDFRAVTVLQLTPNREDDTLIDAEVQVEEWFVPKTATEQP